MTYNGNPYAFVRTRTGDLFIERLFGPLFGGVAWMARRVRWLQEGRKQLYVLYIALAVVVLLVWKLGVPG